MIEAAPNITPEDLTRGLFVPIMVYAREEADFHTCLCLYNYFSEYFPKNKTGATVNM